MRTKAHAFIADLAKLGKTENLVTAGICKDGVAPGHKFVQPAEFADQFVPRTQVEVIRIGKNDARAQFFERLLRQSLYRRGSPHRHEYGRFDYPVRRRQLSAARTRRISLKNLKGETHSRSVSGENKRPERLDHHQRAPDRKHNDVGLSAFQFSGVHRCETNRDQNQSPDRKNVDRFAQR